MGEKVTLTVFKDSPHIWSGGLEDEALAYWLLSKANAILYFKKYRERRARISAEFVSVESCAQLIQDYTYLGISSEESSSIQRLSSEAITHARQIAECLVQRTHEEGFPVTPIEYSLLPELGEEFEAAQRKKIEINNHLIAQLGGIPGGEGRPLPTLFHERPCATFDYLKEEYQGAGKAQPEATRGNQEDSHQ